MPSAARSVSLFFDSTLLFLNSIFQILYQDFSTLKEPLSEQKFAEIWEKKGMYAIGAISHVN
jgi:hypothetical protein